MALIIILKALDADDLHFQDVKEGHKVQATTKQPKRSRTGFKLSMFGLFGGKSQVQQEEDNGDDEGTREQLMEEWLIIIVLLANS